jgi:TfoX/Sxy family transcriptional regulator of competence genes
LAYDEDLANRIRALLGDVENLTEKRMFGGLGFSVNGNLAVSASGRGGLLVRIEPSETAALLERAHVGPFETRGRALNGWLRVDDDGIHTKRQLEGWVKRGVAYASSLAPKQRKR